MSKPFETTFATLRRGAASMEATEAMQQVVKSVYETGKPAKLVIELTVKPNTKNGGELRLWYELQQLQRVFAKAMEAHVQKLEELLSGELPIYSGR